MRSYISQGHDYFTKSEINGLLAGKADAGHDHHDDYYTQAQLSTADAGAAVHWDNLTSAPAGFADGEDQDTLGSLDCSTDQIAKWNGTAWECASFAPDPCSNYYSEIRSDGSVSIAAECPENTYLTGGGCWGEDGDGSTTLISSRPNGRDEWSCQFLDTDSNTELFGAYAICCQNGVL